MFSAALKSFSSNITANYDISKQPTLTSGVWRVFDGKKKSTATAVSIFVFDRKSLEVSSSGFGARSSGSALRKIQDEVVERLKREASNLARLRHPSILQLVEPIEETRTGGLMFATEPITASLSNLLSEKDGQERAGGIGGRPSRYVVEDADGTRRRRDVELDELEIQKGLLQVAKGLEFLHESAKLVHGNFTPEAIFVNAKSDWKISSLAFAGPPDNAEGHQPLPPIPLSEALYHDPRLPKSVQLNLDYTSPDFVLDTNVTTSADMYSLGLVAVALYNLPHVSPLQTNGNQNTYKKLFSSSSTTPSPSNDFGSSRKLPKELGDTLPRLLARRPAQRMTAGHFQTSAYFNNTLVNAIQFLEEFPTKSPNDRAQFMRLLKDRMSMFPVSVLEKKVLGTLLDEMKDRELLSSLLTNIFIIIKTIPSGRKAFSERGIPRLRDIFLAKSNTQERDLSREAGLAVVLEHVGLISDNCSAKEFKDDILPIIHLCMQSHEHSLVNRSLKTLPSILPVLDFSTVKHDLFPVVASVFIKTSSLVVKVSGLEALGVLCGASNTDVQNPDDDFNGVLGNTKPTRDNLSSLDKFTVQEKVVPLLKGIKTKEPAVMMAALNVLKCVGVVADTDFLALEVLPIMWSFSLGPLLDLDQFKKFMDTIKTSSKKIEREQMKKLQDLSTNSKPAESRGSDAASPLGSPNGVSNRTGNIAQDFDRLVLGKQNSQQNDLMGGGSGANHAAPAFSWSSSNQRPTSNVLSPASRSVTPDTSASVFPSLQPARTGNFPSTSNQPAAAPWPSMNTLQNNTNMARSTSNPTLATLSSMSRSNLGQTGNTSQSRAGLSAFGIPPPLSSSNAWQTSNPTSPTMLPPPPPFSTQASTPAIQPQYGAGLGPSSTLGSLGSQMGMINNANQSQNQSQHKQGLDKYQSLL
ncbi:MAG: hypothetical protein Q9160_000171 [Pyrenula sp. 1 TL-2023]